MGEILQLPLLGDAEFAATSEDGALNVAGRVGDDLCLVVYGVPQPAGSKSAFAIKAGPKGSQHYTGKVGIRDGKTKESAERHKSWRQLVQESGESVMTGRDRLLGALLLVCTFSIDRPKSHYLTGGGLNAAGRAMPFPSMRPDSTKLLRSVEDSLTDAGVYKDDSQIVRQHIGKEWTRPDGTPLDILSRPGVVIRIRSLSY